MTGAARAPRTTSFNVRVGDALPERPGPDINIERIRMVMDAMDDVNPVHIDEELVKRMGLRGLVNQGPSNLSYITNMLTAWTGDPDAVKRLKVRFHNLVVPGDRTIAGGMVTAIHEHGADGASAGRTVDCDIWLRLADGTTMIAGMATVALKNTGA